MSDTDPLSLIVSSIEALDRSLNRRLDDQDRALARVEAKVDKTNGRVTVLEKARERGQGMVAAFRWVPSLIASGVTAGLTILIMAVSGGLH